MKNIFNYIDDDKYLQHYGVKRGVNYNGLYNFN